ncbi:MAG: type VI secretion system membrane subunit TssM [Betaproteobacteria bacterium]|nr:type VI secretion system membrane subunit TssM [Betaproteobacteria bacterium]
MSALFNFLRSRLFWVTVGVIALCVLIWMFGGLLAFGEIRPLEPVWARCCLIGLILLYCLIRLLIARWRAGRMNERIANMLRASLTPETAADKENAGILKDRFAEALSILRKARFESAPSSFWGRVMRRGRYVYELPWYVIIGAPGVGKTTALLNSGLSFPLSGQIGAGAIRGAGGTRNCDWWFTNEAVFIDTAGRYTTHESDAQTDKAEWRGFLSLLKKNRAQQPINGVLVMLSVAELLGQSREDCQKQAATLRQRLDELRSDLGMSFPVYLMINKCDLLLGFDEFFSTLDRSGRAQVWGTTLPLAPSGKYLFDLGQIASECDRLQARIIACLVDLLQAEPDLARRELIYAFPQQFEALTRVLKGILSDLLETSRFSESPFLRGIYFTSATQEGTPFDRVVHALEQSLPVQRPPKQAVAGEGKAYFLQELLSRVVFGEAHIAGRDWRAERRAHAFHVGGYVLSVLALAGATLAWATSRHNNQNYLDDVDANIEKMERVLSGLPREPSTDIGKLLNVLNGMESLLDTDDIKVDHPPLKVQYGLFRGSSLKMQVKGERGLYKALLRDHLAPTIEENLVQKLNRAVAGETAPGLYEALKAYLMMHEPDRLDAKAFAEAVNASWRESFANNNNRKESGEDLKRHVRALVAMNALSPSRQKEQRLINGARDQLKRSNQAGRVFEQIKGAFDEGYERFTIKTAIVGDPYPFIDKETQGHYVEFLYTKKGYKKYKEERDGVLNLIDRNESWVLGIDESPNSNAPANLKRDVDKLYLDNYILKWDGFLKDVEVRKSRDLNTMLDIANRLSWGEDSSLFILMKRVVEETQLAEEPESGGALEDAAGKMAGKATDKVTRVPGAGQAVANLLAQEQGEDPAKRVDNHFKDLHTFVLGAGGDGSNAPILQRMLEFKVIKEELQRVADAKSSGQPIPDIPNIKAMVKNPQGKLPEPLGGVLKLVARDAETTGTTAGTVDDTELLKKEVTDFCVRTIENRYPFGSGASGIAAMQDFAELFKPGGKMDSFSKKYPRDRLPSAFKDASYIMDVFFSGGRQTPEISFTITPKRIESSIKELNLYIGSQRVKYLHDRPETTQVNWSTASDQVRLAVVTNVAGVQNEISQSGLWAWHRLFEGRMRPASPSGAFEAEVAFSGVGSVVFEIRPSSALNPFDLPRLRRFKCPQSMPRR